MEPNIIFSSILPITLKEKLQELVEFNQVHKDIWVNDSEADDMIRKISSLQRKLEKVADKASQKPPSLVDKTWDLVGYPSEKTKLASELNQARAQLSDEIAIFTTRLLEKNAGLKDSQQINRLHQARYLCYLGNQIQNDRPLVEANIKKYRQLEVELADKLLSEGNVDEAFKLYSELVAERADAAIQLKLEVLNRYADEWRLLSALVKEQAKQRPELTQQVKSFCVHLFQETVLKSHQLEGLLLPVHIDRSHDFKQAKEFVGKILFLFDQQPECLEEIFTKEDIVWPAKGVILTAAQQKEFNKKLAHVVTNVEGNFIKFVECSANEVSQVWSTHKKGSLQDADLAVSQALPIMFAKLLVTSVGLVNLNIIDFLKGKLVHPEHQRLTYEKDISNVLDAFKRNPELQQVLSQVQKPNSERLPSNELIRATLRLPFDQSVTNHDAQVVALAGLLSHWRQKNVSSCFVACFAIQTLQTALVQSLKDFARILHESGIKKVDAKGVEKFYTFTIRMTDETLTETVEIDAHRHLVDDKGKQMQLIHKVPGIVVACQGMGIPDSAIEKAVLDTVQHSLTRSFTMREFLIKIAIKNFPKAKVNEAISRGVYRYEAENQSGLLRAWENILGSLEENNIEKIREGMIRLLKDKFPAISDKILDALKEEINTQTALIFESSLLSRPGVSEEHYDNLTGAFVVYDKNSSESTTKWKRITGPQGFQKYCVKLFRRATDKMNRALSKEQRNIQTKMNMEIIDFFKSKTFIESMIRNYDQENASMTQPLKNLASSEHLPWIDSSGGSTVTIFKMYWQEVRKRERLPKPPTITKQACQLIALSKGFQEWQKDRKDKVFLPISGGGHVFSLLPLHPTLTRDLVPDESVYQWLHRTCIEPGKAATNEWTTTEMRQKLIDIIHQEILDESDIASFDKKILTLGLEKTIAQFRNAILDIFKDLKRYDLKSARLEIDNIIHEKIIPPQLRKQLVNSAIHFADSNWEEGVYDVHFCYMVNAGNRELEYVVMNEDGSNIIIVDQDKWLNTAFFALIPEELKLRRPDRGPREKQG